MKNTRPVQAFFGALFVLTVAKAAAAYEQERTEYGARVRLPLASLPARVRLAKPVPPLSRSYIGDAALERAMATWSKESCSSLRFVPANEGEAALIEVHAVTSGWKWGANIGAHTDVQSDPFTGEIQRVVIELDASRKWSDEEAVPADAIDLETVLLHELGHAAGLAHTYDTSAVMRAGIKPGHAPRRALGRDDAAAICALYPVTAMVRKDERPPTNEHRTPTAPRFVLGVFMMALGTACAGGVRWYRRRRADAARNPE